MSFFSRFQDGRVPGYVPAQPDADKEAKLTPSLQEKLVELRRQVDNSEDLVIRRFTASGVAMAVVGYETMFNLQTMTQLVLQPLTKVQLDQPDPQLLLEWIRHDAVLGMEQNEVYTYGELFKMAMSGFIVMLVDGVTQAIAVGVQGYNFRSVSEPSSETNVRGSHEGFVEPVRINISLVRRRIKSTELKFEKMTLGERSSTDIYLVYMRDVVSEEMLLAIRRKLGRAKLNIVLNSGYLQPFLEGKPLSFFSGVGTTERPDTLAAKVSEGRIGILVDGTPFALVVPTLFSEYFQSMDDYAYRPYYTVFIRALKYVAFFGSMLLPGTYVGVVTFHPELLPSSLLFNLAASMESTPFPLMFEALFLMLLYEIMREAGLRLPQAVGHAVSIVGGLVIGDVAVRAGLVSTSMVMLVALTAISSFVVPMLYEPLMVLRFIFIIIGGMLGLFGLALAFAALMINLCALDSQGVPITAPVTPFQLYGGRDVLFRESWKYLGRRSLSVGNVPGTEEEE